MAHERRSGAAGSIYDRWGIRSIINANATLTALGGSIMPDVVVQAMADASKAFVDWWWPVPRLGCW
jgi:seryl-tRNA(Sec) selenium transferase